MQQRRLSCRAFELHRESSELLNSAQRRKRHKRRRRICESRSSKTPRAVQHRENGLGNRDPNRTVKPCFRSDKRGIELARYRNMRSKYQCSLCLQFALILGAGPVLHRPTSLVIHRLEWNL